MAWTWNIKPIATVKIENAMDNTSTFTIPGCTTGNVQPEQAAGFINTLLDIGGKAAIVSSKMSRVQTEEAVDNG